MLRKTLAVTVAGLTLWWCGAAIAQQAVQDQPSQQLQQQEQQRLEAQREHPGAQMGAKQGHLKLVKADKYIGTEVVNQQGEKLGHIRELAIDGEKGQVAYAVLEFDRLIDLRDKLFAVPWQALKPKNGEMAEGQHDAALDRRTAGKTDETWFTEKEREGPQQLVLNVSKEKLASAPGFDRDKWPDMADHKWGGEVHAFYGQKPYWESERRGEMKPAEPGRTELQPGQTGVDAERETEAGVQAQAGQTGQRMILKAEKQLIGQDVYDDKGKDIGEVQNLLIDRHTGKIALTVIKFENVEGDKNMAALPWNQVNWKWDEQEKEGTITLKTTVDQVKPHLFAENSWPELNRQYVTGIYRNFNARPFWEGEREEVLGYQD